jgi:hypothetical protein
MDVGARRPVFCPEVARHTTGHVLLEFMRSGWHWGVHEKSQV